ncbi:hypothetical protein Glove_511g10 [Diversispora epigaea]|uniref:Autophagy-related protein 17 n=1 Tax=Diversispora epigaea TaxID=1348612 RepID=A0A397GL18_9GLOM|nr:hypothetical protein Glove_511g10 [Diversispora epigaea]
MPRVNRTICAINHQNPVVGVIMFLQEKIRDLGRRVVNCSVLEAEVKKLRMNLQTLEERLNSVRRERHKFEMERNELEWECSLLRRNIIQEWAQYLRDPVKTYIQRFQLYEYEIDYLSQVINIFRQEFRIHQMPYSILPRPPRWVSTLSSSNHSPTWSENSSWDRSNPLNSLPDPSFSVNNFNNNEKDVNNSEADNSDSDYTV